MEGGEGRGGEGRGGEGEGRGRVLGRVLRRTSVIPVMSCACLSTHFLESQSFLSGE